MITTIDYNVGSSNFIICTVLVPTNIKKKRVSRDKTPLTPNNNKLKIFLANFSHVMND